MDMIQHTQSQKPIINLYKANGSKYNITELVDGIQWSGDYQQVSRKLDVDILYPVNDKNQSLVIPDIGDMMTLFVGEHELFRGVVWNRDLVENSQFMKLTCYDALINVTKSTTSYNLKNVSPESTVKRVCSDFGIPYDYIASSGGTTYSDAAMGKGCYDIIMTGYTEASKKTGKKYMPIMLKGRLNIIEKGIVRVPYELSSDINVMNTQHSESLDSMINKVIIYDEAGNIVDSVSNQGWINAYGLLQGAIQFNKEKDNKVLAKKELKDMERKVQVQALGIIQAITGHAVMLKSTHTKAVGLFYIDTDTHSWKNGSYEMTLTLNFQNLMDEKEVNEDSNSGSGENGSGDKDDSSSSKSPDWWSQNWDESHTHGSDKYDFAGQSNK